MYIEFDISDYIFFLPAFRHTSLTGSTDTPGLLQFQVTQFKTYAV